MIEFEILEKIKQYNRIIIHRHIRPDGDCIGSQSGLKLAIKLNYPEKEVYAVGDIIPEYCTPYGILDNVEDDMYTDALVIVVDTATDSRICDQRYKTGAYIIKIDHHDDSSEYGNISSFIPRYLKRPVSVTIPKNNEEAILSFISKFHIFNNFVIIAAQAGISGKT